MSIIIIITHSIIANFKVFHSPHPVGPDRQLAVPELAEPARISNQNRMKTRNSRLQYQTFSRWVMQVSKHKRTSFTSLDCRLVIDKIRYKLKKIGSYLIGYSVGSWWIWIVSNPFRYWSSNSSISTNFNQFIFQSQNSNGNSSHPSNR